MVIGGLTMGNHKINMEIDGKNYLLLYDLNAIEQLIEEFGTLKDAHNALRNYKDGLEGLRAIRTWLRIGLNNGEDLNLTDKEVGKMLHLGNLTDVMNRITNSILSR